MQASVIMLGTALPMKNLVDLIVLSQNPLTGVHENIEQKIQAMAQASTTLAIAFVINAKSLPGNKEQYNARIESFAKVIVRT